MGGVTIKKFSVGSCDSELQVVDCDPNRFPCGEQLASNLLGQGLLLFRIADILFGGLAETHES